MGHCIQAGPDRQSSIAQCSVANDHDHICGIMKTTRNIWFGLPAKRRARRQPGLPNPILIWMVQKQQTQQRIVFTPERNASQFRKIHSENASTSIYNYFRQFKMH